ncbi:MAG: hypothetical protein Q9180_004962, partial [Flavoplaca navasiana]
KMVIKLATGNSLLGRLMRSEHENGFDLINAHGVQRGHGIFQIFRLGGKPGHKTFPFGVDRLTEKRQTTLYRLEIGGNAAKSDRDGFRQAPF